MRFITSGITFLVLISVLLSCEEAPLVEVDEFNLLPSSENGKLPSLSKTADGNLLFSWVVSKGDSASLHFSSFDGTKWSPSEMVAEGMDWFVNWADYPSVLDLGEGKLLAHFLQKSGKENYAYDVKLTQTEDGGKNWSEPFSPHDDNTPTEHGFVSMIRSDEGAEIVWLDGRNYASELGGISIKPKAMSLRTAKISYDGKVVNERSLDSMTCDCCPTTMISSEKGPVAYYRDRTDEEIRDITKVSVARGNKDAASVDGWKIAGCPVNGPKAAAQSGSRHVLAWFTGAKESPKVQVRFSENGVLGETLRVDEGSPIGRVDIDWLDDTSALVLWIEKSEDQSELMLRKISMDSSESDVLSLATIPTSRSTGMPQLEIIDGNAFVAWTDLDKGITLRRISAQSFDSSRPSL